MAQKSNIQRQFDIDWRIGVLFHASAQIYRYYLQSSLTKTVWQVTSNLEQQDCANEPVKLGIYCS